MSNTSSSTYSNFLMHCSATPDGIIIANVYISVRAVLLLPLCVYVLHLGHQRWRQQRSFAKISHSDIFTFHAVVMEISSTVGGVFYICGYYTNSSPLKTAGMYWTTIVVPGQICLHVLTCVERYLAVVHPVLYRELKQSGGIRIRNFSVVCVWLFSFLWSGLLIVGDDVFAHVIFFCLLFVSVIIICFCSFRVLCVLIRPGPGEVGGTRDGVDQSKLKAFTMILAVLLVLLLWFVAFLVGLSVEKSSSDEDNTGCLVLISANWFSLPSCLVLPLLFLHRAGKLLCSH